MSDDAGGAQDSKKGWANRTRNIAVIGTGQRRPSNRPSHASGASESRLGTADPGGLGDARNNLAGDTVRDSVHGGGAAMRASVAGALEAWSWLRARLASLFCFAVDIAASTFGATEEVCMLSRVCLATTSCIESAASYCMPYVFRRRLGSPPMVTWVVVLSV